MPRNDGLNVPPPPPPPPPMSDWKKEEASAGAPASTDVPPKGEAKPKTKKPAQKKSDSSVRARTRARTNGQNESSDGATSAAEIIGILDGVRARHGHPQLERTSVSHRWPQWAVDTVAKKAQIERRAAADILAEALKRGFAGDPYAEHYYAEACERVNATENDWGDDEEDVD